MVRRKPNPANRFQCGVFSAAHDVFIGRWHLTDSYDAVQVGQTYELKTIGWRFPITSTYPNIAGSGEGPAKPVSGPLVA